MRAEHGPLALGTDIPVIPGSADTTAEGELHLQDVARARRWMLYVFAIPSRDEPSDVRRAVITSRGT